MKKYISLFVLVVLFISLCGCNYSEEYIDIKNYKEIWDMSEIRVVEESKLFPKSVDNLDVEKFYGKQTVYFPIGTGYELLLTVKYNKSDFEKELERIKATGNGSVTKNSFSYDCYATVWNINGVFEYAIIGKDTIDYVYLQLISQGEETVDKKYLPLNYDIEIGKAKFSCYDYIEE